MRKAMMICGLAALMAVAGCGQNKTDSGEENNSSAAAQTDAQENGNNEETGQEETDQTQEPLRAVYLKNDVGELFVTLEQGTPFTGTLPDEPNQTEEAPLYKIGWI